MSTLHLLKYVRSFVDGRVRIRHPGLHNEAVAAQAEARMKAIAGVISVECNPVSGSVLLTYDSAVIPKDRLFAIGEAWAVYLDKVKAGKPADVPEF